MADGPTLQLQSTTTLTALPQIGVEWNESVCFTYIFLRILSSELKFDFCCQLY